MKVTLRAYIFTVAALLLFIVLVIYRYEKLLTQVRHDLSFGHVEGGAPSNKHYTAGQIIALIKGSKEYLGDSVTVFDNGQIHSDNGKFQGTLNAVTGSEANMDIVRSNTGTNNLPIQYNIYVLAAQYYRQQYHIPSNAKPN
ncbi:MAG TPA: hypothetical protein VG052_06635 [Puia sp.]|jgi:hypothetical protein|nr:hypothetical protein [Puia sp.]